jgi:hypothetical protein
LGSWFFKLLNPLGSLFLKIISDPNWGGNRSNSTNYTPTSFFFPANIHHLESKIKSKKCKMKSDFGHFSVAGSEGPKKTKKE